jgi:hypothetical protein
VEDAFPWGGGTSLNTQCRVQYSSSSLEAYDGKQAWELIFKRVKGKFSEKKGKDGQTGT